MNFSQALTYLQNGYRVRRQGWNAVKLGFMVYIQIEVFDDLKVLVYHTKNDNWQWHPSVLDMFATDWVLVA